VLVLLPVLLPTSVPGPMVGGPLRLLTVPTGRPCRGRPGRARRRRKL